MDTDCGPDVGYRKPSNTNTSARGTDKGLGGRLCSSKATAPEPPGDNFVGEVSTLPAGQVLAERIALTSNSLCWQARVDCAGGFEESLVAEAGDPFSDHVDRLLVHDF